MPLPTTDTPWPPPLLHGVSERMEEWSAWYEGTPDALRRYYGREANASRTHRGHPADGGLRGLLTRMWWGKGSTSPSTAQGQLHIPLAADLCQASGDLLFAEPPTLTVGDPRGQDLLEQYAAGGLFAHTAEAAEVAAALGGTYLRATWDPQVVPNGPFLTSVHADAAVPEFRWGRLTAVTFWRRVTENGQQVLRHLERHETDSAGIGIVLHGLYAGTPTDLGRPIPLTDAPATASLADAIDADGVISTGTPGLAVEYVPNVRPVRSWRTHPLGVNLGRSDLDGLEPLMDALDETWSSWMRDVRLAKARLVVPAYMLSSHGPGKGATFDTDEELFTPLAAPPGINGGMDLTSVQFAIRVTEHQQTANELIQQILRSAGYSAATFGEGAEGLATATEVNAREQRSDLTRDRKIRHWKPALARITEKMLAIDAALFGHPNNPNPVTVTFGDAVQDSQLELAQTAVALRTAQAASTQTIVTLQHPDWTPEQIAAEVAAIDTENDRAPLADPATLGQGGVGLTLDKSP